MRTFIEKQLVNQEYVITFQLISQNSLDSIIFRNLKPEHVGFNVRDDITLFDFGLAREVKDEQKVSDHTWRLTGETGSLRYMAPEVAQSKPYGEEIVILFGHVYHPSLLRLF